MYTNRILRHGSLYWCNSIQYEVSYCRLAPVYYISNIFAFYIWPGAGDNPVTWYRTIKTITITNMWHSFELENPYAAPSWTVSTLAAFYLVFPYMLARL